MRRLAIQWLIIKKYNIVTKNGFHYLPIKDFVWPFTEHWWKPTPNNRIRELEKAGALIAAEIDRLLRLELDETEGKKER
jgi:hypothetical protein